MGAFLSRAQRPKVVSESVQTEETTQIDHNEAVVSTPKCYMNTNPELDPRSITRGVPRTPLMLLAKADDDVTPKKAPRKTDLEILEEEMRKVTLDLQQMIKDDSTIDYDDIEVEDEIIIHTEEEIEMKMDEEEEGITNITPVVIEELEETPICEKSFSETPEIEKEEEVPETMSRTPEHPKLQDLRKKLFLTPNVGLKTPETPKVKSGRTPLGAVCPNRSPVVKEWRAFDDERRKLGLENTPPASILPVPDQIQSAPGKMLIQRSKLNRPRWDNENTLFI